uniref:Eva-1-like protein C n=1 Tax=Pipistrellus kuhlii TaxID=59472 RepID=A0A7J7R4J8_PIPKU|nr:eva-1-like protein C [Pipistrellus kuhlii]
MLPPRPAPPPAPPPGARRQGEPPGRLLRLLCAVLVCSGEIAALADFSGYLTKLLQNHTAYACDGDQLSLQCPRHSSISIQAAFYGQDGRACGGQRPAPGGDGPACEAPTTFQKVLDECQSQRACRLLVNSRVFGPDLCPGSSKYLLVSFKCQPNELKNQTVCEGQELTLHCHPSKSLRIYAAAFGRRARDADLCASAARPPPFVPRTILSALDPALAEPAPSPKQEDADGAGPEDPRESGVRRKEGVMVSSSLAAFAYIRAHPDRAALLFVSSVGVGLALTLCALVARVSCARDLQALRGARERLVAAGDGASEDSEDADGSEASSGSSLPGEPPGLRRTAHPAYTALEAAELAERIERREQIIQEIWMNSGLDTSVPRSTGPFY